MSRAMMFVGLLLAGCADETPQPAAARTRAVCDVLRSAFPVPEVAYYSRTDAPDTIARIKETNRRAKEANLRFQAACGD